MKILTFSFVALLLLGLGWAGPGSLVDASGTSQDTKVIAVSLFDYGFRVSDPLENREFRLNFENNGENTHEVVVIRLAPGATVSDYKKAGGLGASTRGLGTPIRNVPPLKSGDKWTLSIRLRPGNYFLTCFVADKKTGKSHLMLGMIHEFSVS